jgi:type I restriction enzyme, R subunit
MSSFKDEMAELLLTILNAYEATGESELATRKLGQFLTARYGSVGESKGKLGELATVRDVFRRMQLSLYDDR